MAREGILLHEGEETINASGAEVKINTPKGKWDNFWYYHKWHVVIIIAAVLLIAFFVHDLLSAVHPDYEIGLITQKGYTDQATEALAKEFEKVGEDLNHDGKVVVQVDSYTIAADADKADPNVQMASVTKFMGDVSDGTSMIFLTDDESFRNEQNTQKMFAYVDGTTPASGASDYDRMRVALKDCKGMQGLGTDLTTGEGKDMLDRLSISMRVLKGSALEGKADKEAYFAASKKMFDKIIKG